ncbi:MAG: NADPH:quinone oxidoreductase [gamma proteobacterium symbiont of Ctena orbiculata]|uniref:NAD(P)H-quinone oxidoreductase n=1 Tax=Candidatus Thiodiazotropha taylori TaxID=2792791 RepID=A0A944M5X0_9GAMM|nr:NAD(P)H-quinone oxidoreductase [Candidatus Thiodiazotropha taylori]MBT3058005.1 NAD(P)H-quinone oxidoreductase [Candidatus Thiodiazotropha sp. (ex Lucina pensylvanica)]PVV08593.1 MAG: NADPH:quinone oxidoreductase [gamma proteobacterium symbiont of Ctena orbiculata]MBT2987764.1 NAD(P)H-quinone oxidoreductase [Candidatus Thiodiazotropha taylori]MBT2995849.1 NAD(P)H-quinone oxidoreductase [Candidatus Thiodiazotropha taylori]
MKAVLINAFGGADVLRIGEVETPSPGPGQVLIEVIATSVNYADIVQREGNYPPPKGDSEILGLEVAGRVSALGPGVSGWSVGDRVMTLVGGGGYAEYAVAYADHLIPIPQSMKFEEAGCVCEAYITAYLNTFMLGALKDGETVLLHGGGGGVNTAAVHLCKALVPDAKVIVTASPGKVERVAELGADLVVDYKNRDFVEEVKVYTDNKGVALILDHIGAAYLASNMKSLAIGGRLVIIGVMGGIKAELNLVQMMVKRQQVIGSVLRSRSVSEKAAIVSSFTEVVVPLFERREIRPLIHKTYNLNEIVNAHEAMESGTHFGKIALRL